MGRLVVQCHPVATSFNAALLDRLLDGFANEATSAAVVRIGQGDRLRAGQLERATDLTFVYPTWWGSPPAALLAELTREIGPWVDGFRPVQTNPLRQVTRLRVVTTHGSPKIINVMQGEPGKRLWERTVVGLCAPGAEFEWSALYGLDRIGFDQRRRFLARL